MQPASSLDDAASASRKPPPSTPRGRRTRDKLLDAARTVFERDGFVLASIVEITREAEVANGTFYTYFDTKEEVFLEVAQQFVDQVASAAKDPGDPAVENLTTTLEGWFDAYAEHGRLLRVLNEGAGHSPVVRRAARDMRRATVGFAAERIRLLQQAGLGDPTADPMLFADLLGGLMQAAAYNHVFLDPSADRARVIAALKLIWERAVLRPAAPVPARRRKPAS